MKKRKYPVGITESRTEPWFRFSRGRFGPPKYFYYGAGGKADARRRIIAYATHQNRTLTPKIEAARKGRMTRSNKSGAVGVSLKIEPGRRRGSQYRYWWARWPGCGSGVKFSILEHKDAKAFCLAQIARELESTDRVVIERAYLARKKAGQLRALLARKEQRGS